VKDFRERWEQLVTAAGMPELLLHDFRRSAVRNMVRRGVPEGVAMRISGHQTRSVFERYNIISAADLETAARKIEAGQKKQVQQQVPGDAGADTGAESYSSATIAKDDRRNIALNN
jgi:hypothetical protein